MPFLDVRTVDEARIIAFARTDMTDAALIKLTGEEIGRIVSALQQPKVVVDFGRVERLSSATLGMLVAVHKTIGKQGGQLRLANVDAKLFDIFKITKLDRVLTICKSTDDAVESLK